MVEWWIAVTELTFLIGLVVIFNYNVNISWDKFCGKYCVFWETLENTHSPMEGRKKELKINYICLPEWLNIFHNEN